ncbi:hypothetical protein [Actinokineospora terrae]|uniref:DNRLRE domain-containing protein n=1 Tax=Actinokineospora terrae TaxID=155974 RepID=A0A1H9X947_9PSEU|nr:hypothetical protein [Actinokineospora terrae]SES42397.1 hypothetical protein SAMN04487818_113132 [Actinokineospora terrae]
MKRNIALRRLVRLGVVVAAAVAGTLVAVSPAQAEPQLPSTGLRPVAWVGVDSRDPNGRITSGPVRLGSWKDEQGRKHVGKAYLTYDISALRTAKLFTANAFFRETAAADCAKKRMIEVWETTPEDHSPTWADQPIELNILPGAKSTQCVSQSLSWDATDAVQHALTRGDTTVTLAIRIAGDQEGNVAFGRTIDPPWSTLGLRYNHTPDVPTEFTVGGYTGSPACPAYLPGYDIQVRARVSDPDGSNGLRARWAFWPVTNPSQRTEIVQDASYWAATSVPKALQVHNSKIAVAVRAEDGFAVSAWTTPCEYTTDTQSPTAAPTVTSAVYPPSTGEFPPTGGTGVPGEFTFGANGVDDIASYHYEGPGVWADVPADRLGGTATVTITPKSWGNFRLSVTAIDRAGLRSPVTEYEFLVRETGPYLEGPYQVIAGEATAFTVRANQDGAVSVTYRLDNGQETTLPLSAEGTAPVTLTIPTLQPAFRQVVLWTTDAAGRRSGVMNRTIAVNQAEPEVVVTPGEAEAGVERTITFTSSRSDIASYSYSLDYGAPTTVPAVNGKGSFTWTPPVSGYISLDVYGTTTSGERTGTTYSSVYVSPSKPAVTSAEYPEGATSGAPGTPGTFHLALTGAAEYVVAFEGQYKYVTADQDGNATVELTPTSAGQKSVFVTAYLVTWDSSDTREYQFTVGSGT